MFAKSLFMEVEPNIVIRYGVERERDLEKKIKRMKNIKKVIKDKNKEKKKKKNKL
tara:strand:+ start:719 stop:883 length:165 start_codon:yes stop_codon:yes gene_type:complete